MVAHDGAAGSLLLGFAVVAFSLLLVYLLYSAIFRAFQHVGFTRTEATVILLGGFFGGLINIPFFAVGDKLLALNVGGALVPLVVTWLLLRRYPEILREAVAGVTFVAVAAYLVTSVTEQGVVSPFPFYLIPVLVASAFSLLAHWRDATHAAPLAYVAGTLGVLIGADLVRIPEILAQPVPDGSSGVMSIGGAAIFDMVFLTGVLAVITDMGLFRRRQKERPDIFASYTEGEVFTPSTPYHVLNGPVKVPWVADPGKARMAGQLDRHKQWEEEVRRRVAERQLQA